MYIFNFNSHFNYKNPSRTLMNEMNSEKRVLITAFNSINARDEMLS